MHEHRGHRRETKWRSTIFTSNDSEPQPCCREIVRITVPSHEPTKTAIYDLTSRRDRALLAADIKDGRVNLHDWPVTKIAQALSASPRSTFRALTLTVEERDDVWAGRRPLFEHRSSVPATVDKSSDKMPEEVHGALGVILGDYVPGVRYVLRQAIGKLGHKGAMRLLMAEWPKAAA
jgi:hypothetical protein